MCRRQPVVSDVRDALRPTFSKALGDTEEQIVVVLHVRDRQPGSVDDFERFVDMELGLPALMKDQGTKCVACFIPESLGALSGLLRRVACQPPDVTRAIVGSPASLPYNQRGVPTL